MEKFELCNLACINVSKLYDEKKSDIKWDLFKDLINKGVRFLDDIIDVNNYILPEFEETVKGNRKIGLGISGYAELLIKLGIKYDSEEHLAFINKFFGFKEKWELYFSGKLAEERGSFPNWDKSIFGKKNIPMRNATVSTQQPTGSVSSILNTTAYGIEPLFNVSYLRRIVTGEMYEANNLFAEMLHEEINDPKKEQKIIEDCYKKGTNQISSVPEKLKELFRCANDISPEWHLKVQIAIQKHIQLGLSKTINAQESHKKDELFDLMIMAWKNGIMGTTYYRNNSRKNQTIQIGEKQNENFAKLNTITPVHRSTMGKTYGSTSRYENACGSFYLTINRDGEGNIVETFVNTSKSGTCKSNVDALNRMLSLALRSGTKVEEVIDQLKDINCLACVRATSKGSKKVDGKSCPDIIARAIEEEYKLKTPVIVKPQMTQLKQELDKSSICPDCGATLELSEGCRHCPNPKCMWSKCD